MNSERRNFSYLQKCIINLVLTNLWCKFRFQHRKIPYFASNCLLSSMPLVFLSPFFKFSVGQVKERASRIHFWRGKQLARALSCELLFLTPVHPGRHSWPACGRLSGTPPDNEDTPAPPALSIVIRLEKLSGISNFQVALRLICFLVPESGEDEDERSPYLSRAPLKCVVVLGFL